MVFALSNISGFNKESNNNGTIISNNDTPIRIIAPAPAIAKTNKGDIKPIRANTDAIIAITPINIKTDTKFIF